MDKQIVVNSKHIELIEKMIGVEVESIKDDVRNGKDKILMEGYDRQQKNLQEIRDQL